MQPPAVFAAHHLLRMPCVAAERHCFDGFMFQVCWGPAVHAMGVVLEHAEVEATVRAALDGLKLACQVRSQHITAVVDGAGWSSCACSCNWRSSLGALS